MRILNNLFYLVRFCNKFPNAQQRESLMCHEISDRLWQKVGVDLMTLKDNNYLVTVDYFSNFWEIGYLDNTLSSTVIRKLKSHFARYGLSSTLVSDNGPQFVSEDFIQFANEYDFEHRTSSPTYAQSNGMVESAVKTAKHLITKAIQSGKDPYLVIFDFRNTPTPDKGASPAQYNLGRRTRTKLPMPSKLLEPQNISLTLNLPKRRKNLKNAKCKWYYDRNAKELEPLDEDDEVRLKSHELGKREWGKGKIVKRLDERSYLIESNRKFLRRNRVHIRKTQNGEGNCGRGNSVPEITDQAEIPSPCTIDNNQPLESSSNTDEGPVSERLMRATRNKLPSKYDDFSMY